MITADTNTSSPFRDNVYVAWDAAAGGSTGGGIRVGASNDHGASFNVTRADDPSGPGRSIGASPAVGPNGELYVAWNDYVANTIEFNRSFDAGKTWGQQLTISTKSIPFDIGIPAESFRRGLVIRCWMSIDQVVRIAGVCIAHGWTARPAVRPTFIYPIPMTKARIGRHVNGGRSIVDLGRSVLSMDVGRSGHGRREHFLL